MLRTNGSHSIASVGCGLVPTLATAIVSANKVKTTLATGRLRSGVCRRRLGVVVVQEVVLSDEVAEGAVDGYDDDYIEEPDEERSKEEAADHAGLGGPADRFSCLDVAII